MTTAIFPIRGQPPHIGHVLTIVSLYAQYDKVIVHVADLEDQFLPITNVVDTFKKIFKYMPNLQVVSSKGLFRNRIKFDDLPPFDEVVSGNSKCLCSLAESKCSFSLRWIDRSNIGDYDISGTVLKLMSSK